MQLEDWLDDLCVRFIINLPPEELVSVERICFQVEEAQWFYEDFIRPLDPSLPSLSLKAFSLRIFQHCPLFSTWSMHHYTSAFAEFLAYKQRVPVRGAIMLNKEMDEVVLVKGWKKGANWSFPRGKINKDEDDLDCAIREVYEETGYDIQAAGLVKPKEEMKYIEVTMREQHMRLYVFRGVPRNTHFEPKTRKEISKIEWYKLTDLPTLKKKHAHHDTQEENPALNANKFYMVAPFLHPLKKWIAQQKKMENRYSSSHLAAPPLTVDESATEGEPGPASYEKHQPAVTSPAVPSSLPEVAVAQNQYPIQDPSAHLKSLLKIGNVPQSASFETQPIHHSNADAHKSNALLALLRNESTAKTQHNPQVRTEQIPAPTQVLHSLSRGDIGSPDERRQLPPFQQQQTRLPTQQLSLLDLFTNTNISGQKAPVTVPSHIHAKDDNAPEATPNLVAPYQRTGDPQFARDSPEDTRSQVIPPANALPKLTYHTRALLDAFKAAPPSPVQSPQNVSQPAQPQSAPNRQALLDAFRTPTVPQSKPMPTPGALIPPPPPPVEQPSTATKLSAPIVDQQRKVTQPDPNTASSLLSLFRSHGNASVTRTEAQEPLAAPVELAAGPIASPKPQSIQSHIQQAQSAFRKDAPKRPPQATKAGETAATVEGPLNQPHFESFVKSPPQISTDHMRRSPVPAHRTLFDPKQPTPTKILQRAEDSKRNPAKSPRVPKASIVGQSPKQKTRNKPEKPFQPQILRRPQVGEDSGKVVPSPTFRMDLEEMPTESESLIIPMTASPSQTPLSANSPPLPAEMSRRASHQTETQKQNLLSLLTGQLGSANMSKSPRQNSASGAVSPLTQSQIVSPLHDDAPISTRSRMSSLASVTSAGLTSETRPRGEKRQTAAGDKAFLLGYLGRIANQEGQAQ